MHRWPACRRHPATAFGGQLGRMFSVFERFLDRDHALTFGLRGLEGGDDLFPHRELGGRADGAAVIDADTARDRVDRNGGTGECACFKGYHGADCGLLAAVL